eukprot:6179536-Pleurochrysis_carterae.AAC.4
MYQQRMRQPSASNPRRPAATLGPASKRPCDPPHPESPVHARADLSSSDRRRRRSSSSPRCWRCRR